MTSQGNRAGASIVSRGMETMTAERLRPEDDAHTIRLDPGAWWGLVAAALLVLVLLVAPILVLAVGDDLNHEVTNVPGGPVTELTQAPAPDAR